MQTILDKVHLPFPTDNLNVWTAVSSFQKRRSGSVRVLLYGNVTPNIQFLPNGQPRRLMHLADVPEGLSILPPGYSLSSPDCSRRFLSHLSCGRACIEAFGTRCRVAILL